VRKAHLRSVGVFSSLSIVFTFFRVRDGRDYGVFLVVIFFFSGFRFGDVGHGSFMQFDSVFFSWGWCDDLLG